MAAMFRPDLEELARRLVTQRPHKVLHTPRRIRILFNGAYIADSIQAKYVWEHPFFPQYYLPTSAFDQAVSKGYLKIVDCETVNDDQGQHVATIWNIQVGDKTSDRVVCFQSDLTGKARDLSGLVKVNFADMDQWFEEDTPIFVHPKDPFKRIEILASQRPVKVEIDGHKVAEATTSMHLYETGLPVRYYLPLTSVDLAVLKPSDTRTQCPYKGESEYYSVVLGGKEYKDIVWYYDRPTIESAGIAGLCCFYNEKVDISLQLNGEWQKLERPKTHFG